MPRPARLRFQRLLAALLWLAASFAFLSRQQEMNMPAVGVPDLLSIGAMSPVSGELERAGTTAERAGPMTMPTNVPATTPRQQTWTGSAKSSEAQASHAHHAAIAPPVSAPHGDAHAGHCPFCFASAFALAAFPVEVLARPPPQTAAQDWAAPAAPHPPLEHQRARAPPFWS